MSYTLKPIIKYLIPRSLLTRFMLIIIVPVLIAQLFAVYLFYRKHWYNVSEHTSNIIVTEISQLLSDLNNNILPLSGIYLNLEYRYVNKPSSYQFDKYIEELEILKKSLEEELETKDILLVDQGRNIILYLDNHGKTLQIQLPYKAILNPTTDIFVLWIVFLTLLLLSVALIFSKNQIRSIIELADAAERYGSGESNYEYKPSGAKEIRQAGIAFLKMKERIQRQTAKRTHMLAMISHDLKTPLTRMKLQVELMDDSEEKEELRYDIDSMKHMIDTYLDFVRGEGGENFQEINLVVWFKQYIINKWAKSNINFISSEATATVLVKTHSFERAITNIVGNAFKYANQVDIILHVKRDKIIIDIEDNGKGIKKEERNKVFKPFYRSDQSRPLDNVAGVGLGLAITKEIITGHYGTITLGKSKKLNGLLVQIKIPKKK